MDRRSGVRRIAGLAAVLLLAGCASSADDGGSAAESSAVESSVGGPSPVVPSTSAAPPPVVSSSAAPPPAVSSSAEDDDLADKGWRISDIQAETKFGITAVSGRLTNEKTEARTGLFTLTIFAGEQRVGTCTGSASEVAGNDTVTAQFVCNPIEVPGDPGGFTYELKSTL